MASMVVSTALLALQCCFVCSHCLLSASAALRRRVRPRSMRRQASMHAGVNHTLLAVQCCVSCAVAVYILGVSCSPSPCAIAGLLRWCQLRFSRCRAAVCSCCLSSASAVLRRRVCPRSMRCQRLLRGCQLRSRIAVPLCVQPLSTIGACCSPSPCASSLDALPGFYAVASTALLALQCCRVQSLSTLGVSCSPSPCALARCAAGLL
jgi:hypothetical protein